MMLMLLMMLLMPADDLSWLWAWAVLRFIWSVFD